MRNLLLEKRNCTIEQDHAGNLILTLLDWQKKGTIEDHVSNMLLSLKENGLKCHFLLFFHKDGLILLPFLKPKTKYITQPIKGIRAIIPHITLYAGLSKSFLAISNIARQVIT